MSLEIRDTSFILRSRIKILNNFQKQLNIINSESMLAAGMKRYGIAIT
jgi:hypothetical protein